MWEFSKVGAFKARGAMNAALQLPADKRSKELLLIPPEITHKLLHVPEKFWAFPPHRDAEQCSINKKEGVKGYGGQIFVNVS